MGDVLSPAEVESLLSAMESSPPLATGSSPKSGSSNREFKSTQPLSSEKTTSYDFRRPDRIGKEQLRVLQTIHEGLGRHFGTVLSALLRSTVEVTLTSVDQLTYSEFAFSLENPTCFNILRATPLDGNLILDINPSILYPIIDRLLGGGRDSAPVARRPLTEIELRIVSRVTNLFLQELKRAWEDVVSLELKVEKVESNPQLLQIVPPNEVVVLVGFELTLGDQRGMMNLCIPFISIKSIADKLSGNNWSAYGERQPSDESKHRISQSLKRSVVEVSVHLAETKISTSDMIGLRVGDIITTDQDVHTPISVSIEGIEKFHAKPGAFKGRKAVQIEAESPPK